MSYNATQETLKRDIKIHRARFHELHNAALREKEFLHAAMNKLDHSVPQSQSAIQRNDAMIKHQSKVWLEAYKLAMDVNDTHKLGYPKADYDFSNMNDWNHVRPLWEGA